VPDIDWETYVDSLATKESLEEKRINDEAEHRVQDADVARQPKKTPKEKGVATRKPATGVSSSAKVSVVEDAVIIPTEDSEDDESILETPTKKGGGKPAPKNKKDDAPAPNPVPKAAKGKGKAPAADSPAVATAEPSGGGVSYSILAAVLKGIADLIDRIGQIEARLPPVAEGSTVAMAGSSKAKASPKKPVTPKKTAAPAKAAALAKAATPAKRAATTLAKGFTAKKRKGSK